MILIEPTKYAAGVTIWGDYWDLKSLHTTIHEIVKYASYKETIRDIPLGLAYEIRHAYQNDREQQNFGYDSLDNVSYKGTVILWPYLLVQIKLLRDFASNAPTNKLHQSNLFLLEHLSEKALIDINPEIANKMKNWFEYPFYFSNDYYTIFLDQIARDFVNGPQGKSRIKKLPELMNMLFPTSPEYKEFAESIERQAEELHCSPNELHDLTQWPDYKI